MDFDDDDFNMFNQPEATSNLDVDKENSLDRPGTSSSSTVSRVLQSRPGTSSAPSTSRDRPSTSAAAKTPLRDANDLRQIDVQNTSELHFFSPTKRRVYAPSPLKTPLQNTNNQSHIDIQNTSDYHVFSPTKRRVYARSPLKNITNEVNNTNSPSFESMKSIPPMPQSFGSLAKSTSTSVSNKNTLNDADITLPEGSHFSSRRVADDFDRSINNHNFVDDCFGFDVGDDDEIDDNNDTLTNNANEKTADVSKNDKGKDALKEIRARLKRFLSKPDGADETAKKTKADNNDKFRKKKVKSPAKTVAKSPSKAARTPVKRNVVFGDIGAKQKDIRSAFTAGDKNKHAQTDDPITLFGEIETTQDRRRSYSRPQRQRKRRISIDSEESEEEQHSDDEEFDADGKPSKRAKRRKKTAEPNPKELEELEEFARKTNAHFEEIDSFALVVE